MLIKTKLRPKELNEFNRWFGDLKHSITPIEGTSRQIQERIEDERVSSQIILSSEKLFIQDIKGKYFDKKVLVVAHNGVISVLSCILEGMPKDGNFESKGIKNGEVKEFEI